jgi:hypothetical protein
MSLSFTSNTTGAISEAVTTDHSEHLIMSSPRI